MARIHRSQVGEAANELAKLLRSSGIGKPLRIRKINYPEQTGTDGWCVSVATIGQYRPNIEIWHDRFLDGISPVFWVGFGARKSEIIRKLIDDCPKNLFSSIELEEDDRTMTRGLVHLKKIPPNRQPIIEYYDEGSYCGIYGKLAEPFDVAKAIMFVESIVRYLPEFEASGPDIFPSVENRMVVTYHLRRERDAGLARGCKKRDGYRCQICSMKFVENYGSLGESYAEAHHIVPLSTISGEIETNIEHLITVCANCHRMLHKLTGEEGDIDRLRKLWNKNGGRH